MEERKRWVLNVRPDTSKDRRIPLRLTKGSSRAHVSHWVRAQATGREDARAHGLTVLAEKPTRGDMLRTGGDYKQFIERYLGSRASTA